MLGSAPPRSNGAAAGRPSPTTALIYGADGTTFVYTVSGPGSFVREAVEVARVEGRMAELLAGPRAGVQVVTVGAAEVYGTEFEVGH